MYTSVKEIRAFNGWMPFEVKNETLAKISGTEFKTSKRPLVDNDFDGQIIDDVVVYVNGTQTSVSAVDAERGVITLASAPPSGATVTADYYWHPIGDSEIQLAIGYAEAEIRAATGIIFEAHTTVEHITLYYGSEFSLAEPIIAISEIIANGKPLASDEYEILAPEAGRVKLKMLAAGIPAPPWFLPRPLNLKVTYQAGYAEVPDIVRQAATLIASYQLLLRLQRQITFSEDYGGVAAAFKSPAELTERLEFLREEVERVKSQLPRRVGKI
ncbi:MAG: hypothetical protein QXU87_04000 [Candidatus Caldarchaeum sp.]